MRVFDPGHKYLLYHLDGPGSTVLQFVKREGDNYPRNRGHYEGTTSQEVLRALIDRAKYVHDQIPCDETRQSIIFMEHIIWRYEQRAAARHGRDTNFGIKEAVFGICCPKCGHVGCKGECHEIHHV
jgi:hypothetical protein